MILESMDGNVFGKTIKQLRTWIRRKINGSWRFTYKIDVSFVSCKKCDYIWWFDWNFPEQKTKMFSLVKNVYSFC